MRLASSPKNSMIGGGVVDLAARLGERLALLAGHDEGDVVAIGDDEVEPAAQDLRALLRQRLRPGAEGALRRLDRADRLGFAEARDLGEDYAGRRIGDRTSPLADPFAVDEALAFQERGIGEFHREGLQGWRAYSKESGAWSGEVPQVEDLRIIERAPVIAAKTASMISPAPTASTK